MAEIGTRTPGDWYVHRDEDGNAIAIAANGVGPNGGWVGLHIARMPVPDKRRTWAEINANAHLCVAAPAVLAALKNVTDRFERALIGSGTDPEYAAIAVSSARAVLAKAEGRS